MKRTFTFTLVLILTFLIAASAVAETKPFAFYQLSNGGGAYMVTATKAGGSAYSATFYVTCTRSVAIDGVTYYSNLEGGDKVEFQVFNANQTLVTDTTRRPVCTLYDKTEMGYYTYAVPANAQYYIAGRMHTDSAHPNKNVVGRWTP